MYYFKRNDCWSFTVPRNCSWHLRRILKCRNLVDDLGGWSAILKNGQFSIKQVYNKLRPQPPKVPCRRIICNSLATPKSLFITWLAVQNRLFTKDRMLHWHMSCDPMCVLCGSVPESVDHLFFSCAFSKTVRLMLLAQLRFRNMITYFTSVVQWVAMHGRKTCPQSRLLVMGFAEVVYCIWLQRNAKICHGSCKEPSSVFRDVLTHVLCRCPSHIKDWLFDGV